MAEVIIYTKQYCPYCVRAKQLLAQKNVQYQEVAIDHDAALRQEMIEKSGGYTVPQIFIDGKPIGGCDDMFALESRGQLDELLNLNKS